MKIKTQTTVIAGLLATILFTGATVMAALMGLPKMSPPAMLAEMLGVPIGAGWVMHFMIGIVFAFVYSGWFSKTISWVNGTTLKGILFGVFAFVFAQMIMLIMGMMITMPPMQGSAFAILMESLMGHVIFGVSVVWLIKALQTETVSSAM